MKKRTLIISIAIILLLAIAAFFYLTTSAVVVAQLLSTSGNVLVNGNPAAAQTPLKEGDTITTSTGNATVAIRESVLVMLTPNTEIVLTSLDAKHVVVTQNKGRTWNNFIHTTTVEEFDLVRNGEVTTAKGTFFSVDEIKTWAVQGGLYKKVGSVRFFVDKYGIVIYQPSKGEFQVRDYTAEEIADIEHAKSDTIAQIRLLIGAEIRKNDATVNSALVTGGFTKEQMYAKLTELENTDKKTVMDLKAQSPVKLDGVEKVAEYIIEIQNIKKISIR